MKQTVCSVYYRLNKHVLRSISHRISMWLKWVRSSLASAQPQQAVSWLTACREGGGGALWNTPRPQAVKHKGLLLYPVQIIINLTVYETHCEGGRLQPIQEQIVHPVRNLTYSIIKSLQPGLIHSPPLSNTPIHEWATIVYRLSIIVSTKMIPGQR